MLYLIGLGLWNEKDISLRGLEACKKCDYVYAELYTEKWGGNLDILGKMMSKKITILDRSGMEENSKELINKAKEKNIAILVPGNPLFATTHIKIIHEAKALGIKTEIIHSSSIYTAVAESGLSIYNFGKTVSVPSPQENYNPSSFYEEILKNKRSKLHTLVLLDIEMSVQEGLRIIMEIEDKEKKGVMKPNTNVIIMSQVGSRNKKIEYDTADVLSKESFPAPAVIIVPGKLHFTEEEFLENF